MLPSVTLWERGLRGDLLAMRHLPPGMALPRSSISEVRALFADLLRLADDVDPLNWALHMKYASTAKETFISMSATTTSCGESI